MILISNTVLDTLPFLKNRNLAFGGCVIASHLFLFIRGYVLDSKVMLTGIVPCAS